MIQNMEEKQKVANKILEYGRMLEGIQIELTLNTEENRLYKDENDFPTAFFFGMIFDQLITAEQALGKPLLLKQRLGGHLDVKKLSEMNDDELTAIFNEKPKLGRYPNKNAKYIKENCKMLMDRYDGNPANIWNDNPRCVDLQQRFELFKGIGQQTASKAMNILTRDFGILARDKNGIDVSYSVHVKKVFLRTGLAETDDVNTILQSARELNPEYPGELDLPIWDIGKRWCHPTNPKCDECPIADVCPRIIK